MRQLLNKISKGNWTFQITSDVWANGRTVYTVSKLHNTKFESVGDFIKTYKTLSAAQAKYNKLSG